MWVQSKNKFLMTLCIKIISGCYICEVCILVETYRIGVMLLKSIPSVHKFFLGGFYKTYFGFMKSFFVSVDQQLIRIVVFSIQKLCQQIHISTFFSMMPFGATGSTL
jgi:hypothetical protein